MSLKCIVVDDDPMSIKVLENLIEKTEELDLIGTASDGISASNILGKNKADLIFLDVEMPDMSGLELISTLEDPPQIILVSGKKDYALEAFDYDVTDYLLKPVNVQRFLKAVARAREKAASGKPSVKKKGENEEAIYVKDGTQLIRLNKGNILYIEAYGDYVNIHAAERKYTVHSTMKNMENKLPENTFMRVHRSFIVRLDSIDSIDESMIFIDEKVIPIGGSYKDKLIKRLNLL